MAAVVLPHRRASRTPARVPRIQHSIEAMTEPPSKKRKYIPGGPGGGGRWTDGAGNDLPPELCPPPVRSQRRERPSARTRSRPRREAPPDATSHDEKASDGEEETPVASRSAIQTRPRRERPVRYVPPATTPRPRYSNAAAAAAASQASDGYKPREERSWEDFHPDLDIEAGLFIFTADEVDGKTARHEPNTSVPAGEGTSAQSPNVNGDGDKADGSLSNGALQAPNGFMVTPMKRRPGRPPRRPESMLIGLGSPQAPRVMPLPTHNPKERLNLPKPSFRHFSHFLKFEEDQKENKVNYVDRTMANVGYQESDRHELPPKALIRFSEAQQIEDDAEVGLRLESEGFVEGSQSNAPIVSRVEYDMDEQDEEWLDVINEQRRGEGVDAIKPAIFEITMTQIEKEYHALEKRIPKPQPRHAQTTRPRSSSQAAVNGDPNPAGDEPDTKCAICDDGDCENANAIIFCDGCDLAVHQECYGVPFIPEGQWFCRKCKEIGRGTPTCLFCPNVDGAFKQTNTLRWSHLLCAIWIPEVTIANMTFMEPITDVDKVPRGRWKLSCYICNQKMGACIQCGNKNCYQAFHVTCARRAKLFLKMKSAHQQGLDTSALKAFCDKHVPPEWRRTHDTDVATAEAKQWYRHTMKDRRWADSQTAAMELGAPAQPDGGLSLGDGSALEDTITVSNQRRKKATQPQKLSWRLPSGAPVVPEVVFRAVDNALVRFTVRKRREFVEKACRYWTLKREARRGAALLKRLQLQLEGFSTMEVTRRNFAGMGAVGGPRLQRRIEFAEMLQGDMARLQDLCRHVREREELRLREIETLRELVDTVYFPITAMLWPILFRAQKYDFSSFARLQTYANDARVDEKSRVFAAGLEILEERLRERFYTSVNAFSRDLSLVFSEAIAKIDNASRPTSSDGPSDAPDLNAIHEQLLEVRPGTKQHQGLTQEQKDLKRLAKRIVKAVREPIESALRKESELRGTEVRAELEKLDSMGLFASEAKVFEAEHEEQATAGARSDAAVNDGAVEADMGEDVEMTDAIDKRTPTSSSNENVAVKPSAEKAAATEPLSPPISTDSSVVAARPSIDTNNDVFANGGVPWYLETFDPVGTTVHDERYTGRAVLRDMSEELSDMDEDTLAEIGASGVEHTPNGQTRHTRSSSSAAATAAADAAALAAQKAAAARKKPKKGSGWTRPRKGR